MIETLYLASICNQVIRHRFVKVILGEARVEFHDSLELVVLVDRNVDGSLNDEPSDCLRARRSGQGAGVGVDRGSIAELYDGPAYTHRGVSRQTR